MRAVSSIIGIVFTFLSPLKTISAEPHEVKLSNGNLHISWHKTAQGWKMVDFKALKNGAFVSFGDAVGSYSIIRSEEKPSTAAHPTLNDKKTLEFPEKTFKYVYPKFQRGISEVPLGKGGTEEKFYPTDVSVGKDWVRFSVTTRYGRYVSTWTLSKTSGSDVDVSIMFIPNQSGYYSLPSVTLALLGKPDLAWAGVPGFFIGNAINSSLPMSYTYGHGLPSEPIICRESTITTMISFLQNKNGLCLSVIPSAEHNRNPYEKDQVTHDNIWNVGLSHMNRDGQLSPTAYHPVLGENSSYQEAGDTLKFNYFFRLKAENWYSAFHHTIYNYYKFDKTLHYKSTQLSLSERLLKLYEYIIDEKKAMWRKETLNGKTIAAQAYKSGVKGADNDALKNSDIGALWMLAEITNDPQLSKDLLPYIRQFKIEQQVKSGFFQGAVEGQYYLYKSKKFSEEWGNHFEPTAITYYTMMDLGNILLFKNKKDAELKQLLKNGADRLLTWQRADGSWDFAYDRDTQRPIYEDLQDLRPTFYGQLIAYRLLGDKKYLQSAIKGADWLLRNAVDKLSFVGVCGDARFVNDFATIQCSMALYELYEITQEKKYLDGALETARYYTTSIYTHPIPTMEVKSLKGVPYYDWQLSENGLSFEHGGVMGSAVDHGPILLASHCAYFVKLHQLTNDRLFIDMARAAALGRDAFVHKETGVASYYWKRFDQGSGPFPHHAIWQIGWIYDYLIAECEFRSKGRISFPRGFMTPKVGPHKSIGFASGLIDGVKCHLVLQRGKVSINNPNIDYVLAESDNRKYQYIILLNQQNHSNQAKVRIHNLKKLDKEMDVEIPGFGIQLVKIENSK